ncbi:MAG TPA: TetR/AcrR family transcriptional regulator [Tissierellaceae bacterium]
MTFETKKLSQSEKILLAASECISTRGYANVSMRDIANEAGVVLSQINYYFNNKEGLFKEVIKMVVDKYKHEIEEILKAENSPKERIKLLITHFKKTLKNNPKFIKLLYEFTELALWSPAFSDLLRNLYKELSEIIEKYILNNLQFKNKKEISTKSISRLIIGSLFGTGIQVLLENDGDDDRLNEVLDAMQMLFE